MYKKNCYQSSLSLGIREIVFVVFWKCKKNNAYLVSIRINDISGGLTSVRSKTYKINHDKVLMLNSVYRVCPLRDSSLYRSMISLSSFCIGSFLSTVTICVWLLFV